MTVTDFPTRIVDINYSRVLMLPAGVAHDWLTENGITGEGWVGIQGDRAYITDKDTPVRLGPSYPGKVVTPLPEWLASQAERFLIAEAQVGDDCWGLSGRVKPDDTGDAWLRAKITARVANAIQTAFAKPCDTAACDRRASNHGTIRVNGDEQHIHVCHICTNAIQASRPDGPMSVLLMPYFAFTEYDA